MQAQNLNIETVIAQRHNFTLIDARSESEFKKGHIEGAINIPLLNDVHRKEVGTLYKQEGREAAVKHGLACVGPNMVSLLDQYLALSELKKPIVFYCWRGGLRSLISATLLQWSGHPVSRIVGGYKSYRSWVQQQFQEPYRIKILGGATGSGKTELLHKMKVKGAQIIDLEGIANHKGSAFGALGQPEQPSTEHFENQLALALASQDKNKSIWFENESRLIGTCFMPEALWKQLMVAPIFQMNVDTEVRVSRLVQEYGSFDKAILAEKTEILRKKLGGQHANRAIELLHEGNMSGWIQILLVYYDKTYGFGSEKNASRITSMLLDWNNPEVTIDKLIEL